jgi:tRNA pseudouridine38-40 synthase
LRVVPVFKLTIEYAGGGFHGWQEQADRQLPTVQGVLREALSTVVRQPVALTGASRTDAGVHALGQVASFEAETDLSPERVAKGATALAGPAVAVVGATVAPAGFDARRDSVGKRYRYRVLNRPAPSPILGETSWHVPRPLDLEAMSAAASRLVGVHDFAGFRAADCGRKSTERELTRVALVAREGALLDIEVEGTAFLKNMVRIIAGTIVDIGLGAKPVDLVDEVLESGDRTRAGRTAPAHGLTLIEVLFPEGLSRSR